MVSASVARATDGAAPNKAAKLLGLKIVPRIEKPETKKPPTKKRIKINFNRCSSLAFLSEVYEHRIKNQVQTVSGIWSGASSIQWIPEGEHPPHHIRREMETRNKGGKVGHKGSDGELRGLAARLYDG